MSRTQDREVAMVQRCQLRLTQALGDGKDGRVYEADVGVFIASAQVAHAKVVRRDWILYPVRAVADVIKDGEEACRIAPCVQQLIDFNEDRRREDRRRQDENLSVISNHRSGRGMSRIATIEQGVQHAGVKN